MLRTTTFKKAEMERSAGLGFTNATDLADYLVLKGLPFRDAHHVSGSLVGKCVKENRALDDLSLEELRAAHPAFEEDVYEAISLKTCVERRSLRGGPAPVAVEDSICRGESWMQLHSEN
jgi:argininosuccinate lyase